MTAFDTCGTATAGINVLACFSAEASYLPAYAILIVFFAIVFFRLELEPVRDRFATSLFVTSIISMLFAVLGFLPSSSWSMIVVLSIGSAAILLLNKEG